MSLKFCTAARSTMRPMRPNPLMPILVVMEVSLLLDVSVEAAAVVRPSPM
jgi:hypothetical protein